MIDRPSTHAGAYRALTVLYPRSFRNDYLDLMVQAFQDDLDERGARRVWSRALGDLLVSVPIQHVEAAMSKPSSPRAAQAVMAASVLALLAVVAAGRYVVVAGAGVVALATAAFLYWRSKLPYREAINDASAAWWKLIAAGAGVLGVMGLVATYGPHLPWFPWNLAAFLYLSAWVAMIVGAALGLVQVVRRLRARPVGV